VFQENVNIFFSRLSNSQCLLLVCASLSRLKVCEILFRHWPVMPCLKYLHKMKKEEEETQLKREVSSLHVAYFSIIQLNSGKSTPGEVSVQGYRFSIIARTRKLLTAQFSTKSLYWSPLVIKISCSTLIKFKWRDPSLGFPFLCGQA